MSLFQLEIIKADGTKQTVENFRALSSVEARVAFVDGRLQTTVESARKLGGVSVWISNISNTEKKEVWKIDLAAAEQTAQQAPAPAASPQIPAADASTMRTYTVELERDSGELAQFDEEIRAESAKFAEYIFKIKAIGWEATEAAKLGYSAIDFAWKSTAAKFSLTGKVVVKEGTLSQHSDKFNLTVEAIAVAANGEQLAEDLDMKLPDNNVSATADDIADAANNIR
jgi:hypothetical protein